MQFVTRFVCVSLLAVYACPGAYAQTTRTAASEAVTPVQELLSGLVESATAAREFPGWHKPKHVLILGANVFSTNQQVLDELKSVAPDARFSLMKSANDTSVDLTTVDVLIGLCQRDVIAKATNLRWVQATITGVEQCVAQAPIKNNQVLLTNVQRVDTAVSGEHALAMMLSLARNLPTFAQNQVSGKWDSAGVQMRTLRGKTLLVVGLGGIGTEVGKQAHAIGMKVVGVRASGRDGPPFVSYVGLTEELPQLVPDADVVVNAVPLTPATTNMYDAKFFASMKPSAFFINVARGKSVNTNALVDALKAGRLAGAAMDTTDPEPLPSDHPLWRLPNVLITPHVSNDSDLPRDKLVALVKENLRRYVAGEKLFAVVDPARGY